MRRLCSIILALGALGLAAGCKPTYDGVSIRFLYGEGQHAHDRLEITEGQAVVIHVRPVSKNPYEDYENFDLVELESFNENILLVAPGTDLDKFVLAGAGLGDTVIRVIVNGEQEDLLDATVREQVAP